MWVEPEHGTPDLRSGSLCPVPGGPNTTLTFSLPDVHTARA